MSHLRKVWPIFITVCPTSVFTHEFTPCFKTSDSLCQRSGWDLIWDRLLHIFLFSDFLSLKHGILDTNRKIHFTYFRCMSARLCPATDSEFSCVLSLLACLKWQIKILYLLFFFPDTNLCLQLVCIHWFFLVIKELLQVWLQKIFEITSF